MAVSAPVVNPDLQVMSAQAEGALLRKDEGRAQRCDEAGAEETGAVGSGASVLAGVSDPLQVVRAKEELEKLGFLIRIPLKTLPGMIPRGEVVMRRSRDLVVSRKRRLAQT